MFNLSRPLLKHYLHFGATQFKQDTWIKSREAQQKWIKAWKLGTTKHGKAWRATEVASPWEGQIWWGKRFSWEMWSRWKVPLWTLDDEVLFLSLWKPRKERMVGINHREKKCRFLVHPSLRKEPLHSLVSAALAAPGYSGSRPTSYHTYLILLCNVLNTLRKHIQLSDTTASSCILTSLSATPWGLVNNCDV